MTAARQAGDRVGEAEALGELGSVQQPRGEYPAAAASLARAVALFRDLGDRPGEAYALNQLGFVHVLTGDYPAAAASQQRALALARSGSDRLGEATRSEEHTSELQSPCNLVCRLLLEKKNKI